MTQENPGIEFLKCAPKFSGRQLVDAYAQHLLQGAGIYDFPVNLAELITYYQITIKPAPLSGQRGAITEGLKVLFNSDDPQKIQLFSQAHELIEMLFLALREIDPTWLSDTQIKELNDNKESLCESGAAELLMPMRSFRPLVENAGVSLQTAKWIARNCGLSLTAVTRRMLETSLRDCIFVIWKFDHKSTEDVPSEYGQLPLWGSPTSMDPPKKLRVDYFYRSPTVDSYIRIDKSVKADTSIAQAFEAPKGMIVRGYDYMEIKKEAGCYLVESISVNFDGQDRVMSLIFFDDRSNIQYRLDNQ